jgi:hypothetical protein
LGVKSSADLQNPKTTAPGSAVPVWPAPQVILLHPQVENPGKSLVSVMTNI